MSVYASEPFWTANHMGNVTVPEPYRVYTLRSEKVLIIYQVPERPG
jgi:hypothetical protein